MKPSSRYRRSGFTLMELLIVVAIIGILAGLVSSAIVKITGTAAKKRIESNADRLRAAIQEYWHDMGRWPLPGGATPKLVLAGKKKKDVRSDDQSDNNTEKVYSYTLLYKGDGSKFDLGDNGAVVQLLLDALLPDKTTRKTFIDLHGFTVPVQDPVPQGNWPCTDVVDAWSAVNGDAVDGDGNPVPKRDVPVLCYFSKFIFCPHCKRFYHESGTSRCDYDGNHDGKYDCKYAEEHDNVPYKFTDEDRQKAVNGALPYTIQFDLKNNIVDIKSDPGSFQLK